MSDGNRRIEMMAIGSIAEATRNPKFAGSGPQFIAAEKTGRRCYGLELEPIHVQTIINRWEKFTGRHAEKIP